MPELETLPDGFIEFLIKAKLHTYASQGDDATVAPLLPGSRQLEFGEGPFFYRDIYFGMGYFVGQETVCYNNAPIWSMSYAGGVEQVTVRAEVSEVYAFLRAAMHQISPERPLRGPAEYREGDYLYRDRYDGSLNEFWGIEIITRQGAQVYSLRSLAAAFCANQKYA
ncbi:MAG TPA: DUF5680 domain-containing protein [Chloroflexia bacterium]|nr:DUF5680 domain-containing protein [Chloroflexia bacterium]